MRINAVRETLGEGSTAMDQAAERASVHLRRMREELGGEQKRIGDIVTDVEGRLATVRATLLESATTVSEVSDTAEGAAKTMHDALRRQSQELTNASVTAGVRAEALGEFTYLAHPQALQQAATDSLERLAEVRDIIQRETPCWRAMHGPRRMGCQRSPI